MTDQDKLGWLSGMICEYNAKIEFGIAVGCMCMSCWEYVISWEDENDKVVRVSAELLGEAIEEGAKIIPNPWGF